MKKTILLLAALASTTAATHAQTTPPPPANAQASPAAPPTDRSAPNSPEQQAQNQANLLAQELSLTPEQQTRVQQAFTTLRQERQAALQKAGGNRRAMAQAMRADRDKLETQLKGILTPDQFSKYQQLIAQRREQIRERRTLREH